MEDDGEGMYVVEIEPANALMLKREKPRRARNDKISETAGESET